MASIIINKDAFKIDEQELEHGELTIGRNSDNDIHLDDSAVSGHHAKLVTLFNASYIEDVGSTNGTFVNGNQTKEHSLHNGDVITIGNYQLMFVSKDEAASVDDSNETMMLDRSDLDRLIAESKAKSKPVGTPVSVKETVSAARQSPPPKIPVQKRNIPTASEDELKVLQNVKAKMEMAKKAEKDAGNKSIKAGNSQSAKKINSSISKPTDTKSQSSSVERLRTEELDDKWLSPFTINLLIFAAAIVAVILLFMLRAS